jgi:hypothetical protein
VSALRNKKNAPAGESGNRAKRWPDNVQVFHIADLPVDTLDQGMMRLLRKIADEKGWTVEEVIAGAIEQWVERCKAEQNLEGKIIRFPNRKRRSEKQVSPDQLVELATDAIRDGQTTVTTFLAPFHPDLRFTAFRAYAAAVLAFLQRAT